MPNRLANETSPYLLQHQDNPVDWFPWGAEALARAKDLNRPILVSVGYSACHWCHVMAHESFENDRLARFMNDHFVNIKVDREERPDIDSLYMSAVQAMTGHGGWPLNAFLTPEGVPFFGGTYWPPDQRMGMPSFMQILEGVAEAWETRRDDVNTNAAQLQDFLQQTTSATPELGDLSLAILDAAFDSMVGLFDPTWGGFGGAPKFPQPSAIDVLLRHDHRTGDDRAENMARRTLDAMAAGGIFDHVGGGFARYSVDAQWLVPHFEKMLYDNAQLASVYLTASLAFAEPRYANVARRTLDYVAREMTSPEGGFYSAQDADSEGEEGKFYVWTPEEIDAVLGSERGALLRAYFAVQPGGNFEGKSILHTPRPLEQVAAEHSVSPDHLRSIVDTAIPELYASRAERVWPGRDEKQLTSWNGLMLKAFAEGGRILDRSDFTEIAATNARFILDHLERDGRLLRSYKDGRAHLSAYLEDYAFFIDGLLALYTTTLDRQWIDHALRLTDTMVEEFSEPESPLLFDTGKHHEQLVARPRDIQDGATPSGNSVAASVLFDLAILTGRDDFRARTAAILQALAKPMAEYPTGFARFLTVLDSYLATPRELVLVSDQRSDDFQQLYTVAAHRYEPHLLIARADPADPTLEALLPLVANRPVKDGRATAYLCERMACLPPVTEPADLAIQLDQGTGIVWSDV
ncbi:MAG TPA: thioredoxin domain-containing protein [Thermomicrobiales bacterium]|nr:thioredoxin domain-containing protein [Thermomicrobiales bacterium]